MTGKRAPWTAWTEAEDTLLRELWKSDMKMDVVAGHFPNRQHFTVYEHARRVLKLPARRIPQPVDSLLSWKSVAAHLGKGPATAAQIATATGMKQSAVTDLLNNRRGRLVYISGYARHSTRHIPVRVWALGTKKDARKPRAMTDTERKRKYFDRLRKEEPERLEIWAEKNRVRQQVKKGQLTRRDIAASWI